MKVMEALKQWADQTGINEHDLVDDYDLYAHAEEMRRELESLVLVRAINNSDHLDYIKALLAATSGAGKKEGKE